MNRLRKNFEMKPFKYEMTQRREKWKSINEPLEQLLMIPLEAQSTVVRELVSETCYNNLASMLDLPPIQVIDEGCTDSIDTIIPFLPPYEDSLLPENKKSLARVSKLSSPNTLSDSTSSSNEYYDTKSAESVSKTNTDLSTKRSEIKHSSEQSDILSEFVEVENKIHYSRELMLKHKAILRFLGLEEGEAATWRVKEVKDVSELSEMTLEEQGDFLINKIAADFCDWMRKLGGDEKSSISEEILKELFQVGMDNPASRAICVMMREKRVLYYKLAEFLSVPEKSFHEVLSLHLNWDAEVEKTHSKLAAFNKGLPKDLRFKTPKNKTAETWLEWNKLSADQLSFADVYGTIKDLRSTKEYCKWLMNHAEHKKPQYLIDQGMFDQKASGLDKRSAIDPARNTTSSSYSTIIRHSVARD